VIIVALVLYEERRLRLTLVRTVSPGAIAALGTVVDVAARVEEGVGVGAFPVFCR
jgi:hypothetical protein